MGSMLALVIVPSATAVHSFRSLSSHGDHSSLSIVSIVMMVNLLDSDYLQAMS